MSDDKDDDLAPDPFAEPEHKMRVPMKEAHDVRASRRKLSDRMNGHVPTEAEKARRAEWTEPPPLPSAQESELRAAVEREALLESGTPTQGTSVARELAVTVLAAVAAIASRHDSFRFKILADTARDALATAFWLGRPRKP